MAFVLNAKHFVLVVKIRMIILRSYTRLALALVLSTRQNHNSVDKVNINVRNFIYRAFALEHLGRVRSDVDLRLYVDLIHNFSFNPNRLAVWPISFSISDQTASKRARRRPSPQSLITAVKYE